MSDFYNSVANESFVEGDLTIEGAVIADSFLRSDGTPISGGGISGPPVTTVGYIPIWDNITGTSLGAGLDPNAIGSGDVTGPSSSVLDQIAIYTDTTGKSIGTSSNFTKQNVMSNTLHATNNIPSWSAVSSNVMDDSGISVDDINNKVTSSGTTFFDGVVPVYADNTGRVIKGATFLSTFVLKSDQTDFADSTQSTTKDDGAIVLTNGGLGVEGNINNGGDLGVGGDAVITGSLTVNGSTIDPTANGDVSGPGIAVTNNNIAIWDGITGTSIKESATNPVTIDTNGQLIVENPQNISNLAPGAGGLIVKGGAVVQGNLRVDGGKINDILISSIDTKAIAPSTNLDNFLTAWDGTNSKTLKNGINSDLVLLSDVAQQTLINPDIRYITPGTSIPQFIESPPVFVDAGANSVVCISGDSFWMAITVGVNQIWIYSRPDIYSPFVKFGDVTISNAINQIYHLVMDFDGSEIMAATGFGVSSVLQIFYQRGAGLTPYTEIANLQIDSTYIDPPFMTDNGLNVFLLDAPGAVAEKVHVLSRSGTTWTSLGVLNQNATGIGIANRSFNTNGSGSVLAWETNNVIEVWLKTGSSGLIGDWTYSTDLPASNGSLTITGVNTAGDRIMSLRGGVTGYGARNWVFNGVAWVQTTIQPKVSKFTPNDVTPDGLTLIDNAQFDVVLPTTNDWTGVINPCNYTRTYEGLGSNQVTNNTIILVPTGSTGEFVAVTIQTSPLVIQGNSKGVIIKGSSEIIGDLDVSGKIRVAGGIDKLTTLGAAVNVSGSAAPTVGQVLTAGAGGTTATWVTPAGGGGGDVSGPSISTDTAVAVYDGATGKLIKNSTVTIDISGNLGGVANLSADTMVSLAGAGTDMTVGSLNNKLRLTSNGGDIDVIANANNINLNSVKTIVQTDLDVGTTGVNINGTSGRATLPGGVDKLSTLTTAVDVSGSAAPSAGQVLQATGASAAEWVTPAAGGNVNGPAGAVTNQNLVFWDGTSGTQINELSINAADLVLKTSLTQSITATGALGVTLQATNGGVNINALNGDLSLFAGGGNTVNINPILQVGLGLPVIIDGGTAKKITGATGGIDTLTSLTGAVTVNTTDPAIGQVLQATSTTEAQWVTPVVGGDVNGPASSINNNIVVWNGTSGDLVNDGGVSLANLVKKADTTQTITATAGNAVFQSLSAVEIKALGGDTLIVGNKVVVNPILEIGLTLPVIISGTTKKITGATGGIDTLTSLTGAVTVNTTDPVIGQVLQTTSITEAQWVTLPAVIPSVTNTGVGTTNAIALYSDATGQVIKNSTVIIDASGNVSGGTYNGTTLLTETVGLSSDLSINSTRDPTYTGSKNTLIGAKTVLTSGTGNLIVAASSGFPSFFDHSISSGSDNVFLGQMAGHEVTTGDENVFVGKLAGAAYTVSSGNTCIGNSAGSSATGANCVYIGDQCGGGSTQAGTRNTFIGKFAGQTFTTGSRNTLIGYNNDTLDGTGTGQTVIGDEAIGGGANSIAIGAAANGTLPNQCMIGNPALTEIVPAATATCDLGSVTNPFENLTLSGSATVAGGINATGGVVGGTINGMTMETFGTSTIMNTVRPAALTGVDNTIINAGTMGNVTSTARENVIIGTNANLGITTSQGNVFIGLSAGESTTTESSSVYIGRLAGQDTTSGGSNVSIGTESGMDGFSFNNTTIGTRAGQFGTVKAGIIRSVFIGTDTGSDSTSQGQTCIGNKSKTNGISSIAIGYEAVGTASNQCMIGGQFMSEIVPNAAATCNLGSVTNPFDNLTLNNALNNAVTTINGVVQDTKQDAYGFLSQRSGLNGVTLVITPVAYIVPAADPSWIAVPTLTQNDSKSFNTTVNVANRSITISEAGTYEVDYSVSNTTDVISRNFYFAIAVNGLVEVTNTATVQRKQTSDRYETVSKSAILTLAQTDVLTLQVGVSNALTATDAQRTLSFFSYGLSCHRLSDST
jgi:hypothetical protein